MADDGGDIGHKAALDMLGAFASVGAEKFDLTWTSCSGKKVRFIRGVRLDELRRGLPAMLDAAIPQQHNVIVRPSASGAVFIQLDDLDSEKLQRVQPVSFLGLHTSPGNHQAWVAMQSSEPDEDFARRLRKGTGADPSASGATRVAGSLNFKDKYAPDFPRVAIAFTTPGLLAGRAQLEARGLVAAAEIAAPSPVRVSPPVQRGKTWPDYGRCVTGAPPNRDNTGPDISRADFTWCMTAIDWGWSIEDTAARLMEESAKALENGEKYALRTAQNAAAAVERRQKGRE